MQRAGRLGVQVPDEMLNEALRDVAKRNSIPFEQMPTSLAAQGIDYASYREDMRREITMSMLRQRDVIPRIYVSPRELDQALERQASQSDQNAEYDVSHILLPLPESATTEQIEARRGTARDITSAPRRGEDFGQLAARYSHARRPWKAARSAGGSGTSCRQLFADLLGAHETRRRLRSVSHGDQLPHREVNDTRGGREKRCWWSRCTRAIS